MSRARILIVEDSADMRALIEALLQPHYDLIIAENGRVGIAKAQRERPDLILMDVLMPELNGHEATRILKKDPYLAAVPVVLLTAQSDTEHRLAGLNEGADDYISKPFDRRELLARVASLLRISEYRRLLAERNRQIESELDIARTLQENLLPRVLPKIPGAELIANYIPMDKVGGDFYDFIEQDGRLGILLADVSGHGIPGAFLSTVAKMAFHYSAHLASYGPALLTAINEAGFRYSVKGMFLTALYAHYEPQSRRLHYCLAGQSRPLVLRRTTGELFELSTNGLPLGVLENIELEEKSFDLISGDRVVLYTDGLIDCRQDFDAFGEIGLREFLNTSAELSTSEFCARLLEHVRAINGTGRFADDLTFLVLDIL